MGVGINTPLAGSIRAYAGAVTDTGLGVEVPISGSGWLLCNGAAVSRTTFDDLYALITTTYGGGDGSTTFNLPDLRDRFPAGINLVAAGGFACNVKGGTTTEVLSTTTMPSHSHTTTLTAAGGHSHTGTSSSVNGGTLHSYFIGSRIGRRDGAGSSKNIGVDEIGPNLTTAGSYPVHPTVSSGNSPNHTHLATPSQDSTYAAAHTLSIPSEGSGAAHDNMPPYLSLNFVIKS